MSSRRGHACPYCGNFLVPRVTKGGQVPDSEFVRCANQHPPYFYRYPPPDHVTPALPPPMHAPAAPLHPSLQTMPAPTPAFPAHPSFSTRSSSPADSLKRQCQGFTRDGHLCNSTRVDRGCPRKMCRKHCVVTGPCTLNSHERHRTSKDSNKPYARVASSSSARVSSGPSAASSAPEDSLHSEESSRRERECAATEEREFEMQIGYRLSPELSVEEELARMEDDDLSQAMRLSAADHHAATISKLFPSSPPPPPAVSSSLLRLRSLSPSPDLPESVAASLAAAQVFVPSPAPTARAKPPRRQQRQPAASVANKRRPQARTTITTQLNETWMSSGASPSVVPSPTPSLASTVFHVRNGGGRRAFMNSSQAERFTLIFFTGAEPRVLSVDASRINSPRWPIYILSADDKTVADLGSELKDDEGFPITQLDVFLHRQRTWMGIDRDYPHTVSTGNVIFLRRRGVHGPQDQATLDKFLPNTAPAHLRYNVPHERAAIRDTRKLKNIIVVDSDSDAEVLVARGKINKRRAVSSDGDNVVLVSPHRPRLSINTNDLVPGGSTTTSRTSPPPSALFLRSASTTSSASEPPTPLLEAMVQLPVKDKPWPFGLYTVDVVMGFLKIDSTKGLLKDRFHAAFNTPGKTVEFKQATYHHNHKLWVTASEALKRQMLDAGRTSNGLWSVFKENHKEENAIDLT
ncbi:hypothetical protein C8F04DRAFT_1261066 [Mycena alexandri]|uniref:Uncharacterized protein n=1 Tax=Mycena alexandri TaxID=1745969 RepID=A0AAD6SSH2_9AGAR|nr:hypothetical protein C8F04DRAFT_1261066 [Mycena alexandri]